MAIVFLGLGANLGERAPAIEEAYQRLEQSREHVVLRSPLYETEPWGYTAQPRFLNAACAIETARPPHSLLALLKRIEQEMGRRPTRRNGPRIIDLDILMYEGVEIASEILTLPHPGMLERATVLVPLNDIAPALVHPLTGHSICEHLAALRDISGVAPYPPGLS